MRIVMTSWSAALGVAMAAALGVAVGTLGCGGTPPAPQSGSDATVTVDAAPVATPRFTALPSGTDADLGAVWVDADDQIWVAGPGGVVLRHDGAAWHDDAAGLTSTDELTRLWAGADGRLVAGARGALWLRDGAAWRQVTSLVDDAACVAAVGVHGSTDGTLYGACAYYQGLVRLRPGEPTSRELFLGSTIRGSLVHAFAADDVFVILGQGGEVFRYRGGAWGDPASWTSVRPADFSQWVRDVWSPDGRQLVAVGDAGLILRWDGQAWTAEASGTTADLNAVWSSPELGLVAVGAGGVALHHDGQGWRPLATGTTTDLHALRGVGATAVAVGADGVVLRATP